MSDGKPPLSDPMAQAMAEDAAEAARKAAQAPAPAPESQAAPEPTEAADEPPAAPETAPEAEPDAGKKKRTPIDVMASRIGAKTKEAAAEKARADKLESELAAARLLLAARGEGGEETKPAAPAAPAGEPRFTQAELQAEARKIAAADEFNRRADESYLAGKEKFGDWETKMGTLRELQFMTTDLLEAALASGSAPDVLHHLGANIDEAERIVGLSPVRMGVELAKLAQQLSGPKVVKVSQAPEPITPVSGGTKPAVDWQKLADGDNMDAWAAERAKAGDPYATRRKRF